MEISADVTVIMLQQSQSIAGLTLPMVAGLRPQPPYFQPVEPRTLVFVKG